MALLQSPFFPWILASILILFTFFASFLFRKQRQEAEDDIRDQLKKIANSFLATEELGVAEKMKIDNQGTASLTPTSKKALQKQSEPGKEDCELGLKYLWGKGVAKDTNKAIEHFKRSADKGYVVAQYNLGIAYFHGDGITQSFENAVGWFRTSAEGGYAPAQFNLGGAYFIGQGVKQDFKQGFEWTFKAAEQEEARAQFNLGIAYYKGEGVAQDITKSFRWIRKSSEQNYPRAQYNLGLLYYNGEGTDKNMAEAAKWYRKAAEQGDALAQFELGEFYYKGKGVVENKKTAYIWTLISSAFGYEKAHAKKKKLEGQLSRQQITEAQDEAQKMHEVIFGKVENL